MGTVLRRHTGFETLYKSNISANTFEVSTLMAAMLAQPSLASPVRLTKSNRGGRGAPRSSAWGPARQHKPGGGRRAVQVKAVQEAHAIAESAPLVGHFASELMQLAENACDGIPQEYCGKVDVPIFKVIGGTMGGFAVIASLVYLNAPK